MSGKLFIGGNWRDGSGATFQSIDPATGETVWEGAAANGADVAAAYEAARGAFADWAERPLADRIEHVKRYQAVLKDRTEAGAELISRETGKALWETRAELGAMAGKVDISIRANAERAGEREAAMGFGRAVLRHRPHGVAAVLGPFNFPGHLPNGHIVPALLAGDAIVFKPSEETPAAGQFIAECFEAAGLPAGVLNLVQGARESGAALLNQPIDALMFTGSATAGDIFRKKFADNPHIILALELGGDNPLIVWDAGDPDAVATHVIQSAYVTTGQRCSCARRLIVKNGAEGQAIIDAVAALSDRLHIGAWNDTSEPYMGPLISARAASNALSRGEALAAMGGEVIRPFTQAPGMGEAFVRPGLIDMTKATGSPDEEIFAPVLQVYRVGDFDEAVRKGNDTRFGLSAGLISNDEALWRKFGAHIRAGVVNWNRPTTGAAGDMPFGGLGASGNHRPSAYYAADYCAYPVASFEASEAKSILVEMKGVKAA